MVDYKSLFLVTFSIIVLILLSLGTQSESWICTKSCDYRSIQKGVDAARSGDTLIVESATYRESLNMNKPINLLGLDTDGGRPILAPENGSILLATQGVMIRGFEIELNNNSPINKCSFQVAAPTEIYLNDFSSAENICTESSAHWNSRMPINYLFESRVLRNFMGNYWADYQGKDENEDGIGDEPKIIDEKNVDNYPLMQPAENYHISDDKEYKMELIRARLNEPFTIALKSNPTTGYKWHIDYDYYFLNLDKQQFEKNASKTLGTEGTSIFVLTPLKPGDTTISLSYRRPWENIVADVRTFHVQISD